MARTRAATRVSHKLTSTPYGGVASRAGPVDGRCAELVRAAYQVIAERGLEGLRTRDIAAKVGINISTLHYHFETKQALVVAVVEYVAQLFSTVRAPLLVGATPLDEFLHLFETQGYRKRKVPELEIVVQELMLRARRDEQIRGEFDVIFSTWHAVVEEIVLRCIREGYLRNDLDAKTVTAMITSLLIGANMQLGIRPASFSLEAVAEKLTSCLVGAAARVPKKRR
jgi:AcrR family transcriptional regulator